MKLVIKVIYWAIYDLYYAEMDQKQPLIFKFEVKSNCVQQYRAVSESHLIILKHTTLCHREDTLSRNTTCV